MLQLFSLSALRQAAHEAQAGGYLADAAVTRRWLKLGLFVLLACALVLAGVVVMGGVLGVVASLSGLNILDPEFLSLAPDKVRSMSEEMIFIAILATSLIVPALMMLAAAMVVYRRRAAAFLWPRTGSRVVQFGWGFVVMMLLAVITLPVVYMVHPDTVAPVLDASETLRTRLTYVAVAGLGLLIAAAAEEIVFRGVLLRVTATFTRHVWLLVIINGVLFSLIHFDPDPIAFGSRALSGMVWTWAALRLGGISFAIGAHWANNLFIGLFLEPISTAAVPGQSIPLAYLGLELAITLAIFVLVELLARRDRR